MAISFGSTGYECGEDQDERHGDSHECRTTKPPTTAKPSY